MACVAFSINAVLGVSAIKIKFQSRIWFSYEKCIYNYVGISNHAGHCCTCSIVWLVLQRDLDLIAQRMRFEKENHDFRGLLSNNGDNT